MQPRIIRRSFVIDVQSNSTKGHKRKLFEEANMYTTNDENDFVLGIYTK